MPRKSDPTELLLFDLLYLDAGALPGAPAPPGRPEPDGWGAGRPRRRSPDKDLRRWRTAWGSKVWSPKQLTSTYQPGRRSPAWVKVKNVRAQAVVIGGRAPGKGRASAQSAPCPWASRARTAWTMRAKWARRLPMPCCTT